MDVQVGKYAYSKGYDEHDVEQWSNENLSNINQKFNQDVDANQPIAYRGIMKKNILGHPDGSIDIASKLANEILSSITRTGLPSRSKRTLKNSLFDYQYQGKRINQSWAGLLLYHVCERFFYLEKLGMGYLKAINKDEYVVDEQILLQIGRMIYDQFPNDKRETQFKNTRRPMRRLFNKEHGLTYHGMITYPQWWLESIEKGRPFPLGWNR